MEKKANLLSLPPETLLAAACHSSVGAPSVIGKPRAMIRNTICTILAPAPLPYQGFGNGHTQVYRLGERMGRKKLAALVGLFPAPATSQCRVPLFLKPANRQQFITKGHQSGVSSLIGLHSSAERPAAKFRGNVVPGYWQNRWWRT